MCERWFQKRSEDIRQGKVGPYSSKVWQKNLRYAKETKRFLIKGMDLGQGFLISTCLACGFES